MGLPSGSGRQVQGKLRGMQLVSETSSSRQQDLLVDQLFWDPEIVYCDLKQAHMINPILRACLKIFVNGIFFSSTHTKLTQFWVVLVYIMSQSLVKTDSGYFFAMSRHSQNNPPAARFSETIQTSPLTVTPSGTITISGVSFKLIIFS